MYGAFSVDYTYRTNHNRGHWLQEGAIKCSTRRVLLTDLEFPNVKAKAKRADTDGSFTISRAQAAPTTANSPLGAR